ncbi:MAG: endo-1,4-beta-xylanase, partial [Halothiobacillaceae bacterium]
PDARLYINEFGILSDVNEQSDQKAHLEGVIQRLIDADAPIGGIGMEGHFSGQAVPPEALLRILDRFGRFGLPIMITEYDYVTPFEDDLADYTRDVMTVLFSHPAAEGFLMWGFWDGRHWRGQSPMLNEAAARQLERVD